MSFNSKIVDQIKFNGDGLVSAIAQELAFDATMETINDPVVDIKFLLD